MTRGRPPFIISPRPYQRHATAVRTECRAIRVTVAAKAGPIGALPVMAQLTMEPTMTPSIMSNAGAFAHEAPLALANQITAA